MLKRNETYCVDVLEGLEQLDTDSVDLILTDPPYGLEFMGKDWDRAVPPVVVWEECLRVLKPGAFAFIMSSPRQDVLSEMISRLSKAGFETSFTPMYHAFASGFPKACNIGKMISKKQGAVKQGAGSKGNTFPLDREYQDFELTEDAKRLDGSYGGFQPKPAVEVILVCMKPLSEVSFVDQALSNGKGVTWLDNCRIPYENEDDKLDFSNMKRVPNKIYGGGKGTNLHINPASSKGRFPANLLVCDDVLNDGNITKSGDRPNSLNKPYKNKFVDSNYKTIEFKDGQNIHTDSGSFSRYFSLDAWFAKKLDELPDSVKKTYPFLVVPKASKQEKNRYTELNNHPTVKPIKLGCYLITLGSRPGDLTLDPFVGTGTFNISAILTNRDFIGFDNNPDYHSIATKRISRHKKRKALRDYLDKKREVSHE